MRRKFAFRAILAVSPDAHRLFPSEKIRFDDAVPLANLMTPLTAGLL
jgi:hypothetical protein